jgi:ATP-binding cassette, subfamily F, member 3
LKTGTIMLTAHHIYKSYGIQSILEDISLSVNEGERVGLIGPNGCGKTTLMKIFAGVETPDSGTITHSLPNIRIGYLSQGLEIGEWIKSSSNDLAAEVVELARGLSIDPDNLILQTKYDSALQQFTKGKNSEAVLKSLGINDSPADAPMDQLSGGQKTRLMLANIMLGEPQLLFLDEPTNHLDIDGIKLLEDWLGSFTGGALIISHDRTFLDNMTDTIIDLDPKTHRIKKYKGTYSNYLSEYMKDQASQIARYQDQESEIRRMRQDIARTKQQSYRVEITTTSRQPGVRRIAKKVAAKAKSREKKLDRFINSVERIEKPKPSWQMKLEFDLNENIGKSVLITDKLSIGYFQDKPLVSNLNLYIRAGQRIALTGSNGSGKTTFLRTIAGVLPPLKGSIKLGASVKHGYMTQEQELLNPELSGLQSIRNFAAFNETEARNFLHYFLFEDDDPLRPISELSFGERSRLQLGLLVAKGCTFLLLDEPLNHLDIPSRVRFEQSLLNYKGTILMVVHDRYFIERFATEVWNLRDRQIEIP